MKDAALNISNTKVYDLEEAIVASGLPMQAEFNEREFDNAAWYLNGRYALDQNGCMARHLERAIQLSSNPSNSGHCSFLKLIVVNANFTASIKWWEQAQRYSFFFMGSSQSTMHKAKNMNMLDAVKGADPRIIEAITAIQRDYNANKIDFNTFIRSIPVGLELTCRCSTNYLQLRTMYAQRCAIKHRLYDWQDFGEWVEGLPYAKEFITLKESDESIQEANTP